jgi:hypothetical protein
VIVAQAGEHGAARQGVRWVLPLPLTGSSVSPRSFSQACAWPLGMCGAALELVAIRLPFVARCAAALDAPTRPRAAALLVAASTSLSTTDSLVDKRFLHKRIQKKGKPPAWTYLGCSACLLHSALATRQLDIDPARLELDHERERARRRRSKCRDRCTAAVMCSWQRPSTGGRGPQLPLLHHDDTAVSNVPPPRRSARDRRSRCAGVHRPELRQAGEVAWDGPSERVVPERERAECGAVVERDRRLPPLFLSIWTEMYRTASTAF